MQLRIDQRLWDKQNYETFLLVVFIPAVSLNLVAHRLQLGRLLESRKSVFAMKTSLIFLCCHFLAHQAWIIIFSALINSKRHCAFVGASEEMHFCNAFGNYCETKATFLSIESLLWVKKNLKSFCSAGVVDWSIPGNYCYLIFTSSVSKKPVDCWTWVCSFRDGTSQNAHFRLIWVAQ